MTSQLPIGVPYPNCCFARPELNCEWWYYCGHLFSGSRSFGFHLVFFRRRTEGVTVGKLIPVKWLTSQIHFAHFAVADIDEQRFYYGQKRALFSAGGAASDAYHVWMPDWHVRGIGDDHELHAKIRGVELNLHLRPLKPPVVHGDNGLVQKRPKNATHYMSFTRLAAQGQLALHGKSLDVEGQSWMDHEVGNFAFSDGLHGWDWLAIQLDDSATELVVCRLREADNSASSYSFAELIELSGDLTRFSATQFELRTLAPWHSRRTGANWPLGWIIKIAELDADLVVVPAMLDQELDTRGSTGLLYWEGAATVSGTLRGKPVTGKCYADINGYDPKPPLLGTFDVHNDNMSLAGFVANEICLRRFGPGVSHGHMPTGS